MGNFKESMEKLERFVKGGLEYFEKSKNLPSEYITGNVYSALQDALKYLIEERHNINESESEENNFVIHYTSVAALVSMIQDASQKAGKAKEPELELTVGDKKSLRRLYDSVHLNDPDEGNYLTSNMNLPKK